MLWGMGIEIHRGCRTFVLKLAERSVVRTLREGARAAARIAVYPATRNCILCIGSLKIKKCGRGNMELLTGTMTRNRIYPVLST